MSTPVVVSTPSSPGEAFTSITSGPRVAQISDEERAIAIKATQTLGLDVAGVDILRATRGPLVMEVNASPGLEGVETTSGVDIASRMIAWIERQATPEFCLKIGG